jgi:hypothetical protein
MFGICRMNLFSGVENSGTCFSSCFVGARSPHCLDCLILACCVVFGYWQTVPKPIRTALPQSRMVSIRAGLTGWPGLMFKPAHIQYRAQRRPAGGCGLRARAPGRTAHRPALWVHLFTQQTSKSAAREHNPVCKQARKEG